jgi:hypothetical protein
VPDGNSVFIFEVAGLCIGHLGHLHHELMHYFGPETLSRFIANVRGSFELEMGSSPSVIVSRETLPAGPKLIVLPGY